jgi:hypothetical protein
MTKNLITTLFFLLSVHFVFAQYPCVNGISTNPLNPINTQLPSKKNTFFNWQDSIFQVQPINNDCIRGSLMESPFYKIDNLEELRDSKDMKWEDGWELIKRGFGLTDQNTSTTDIVPNAYFILYNKYTGIMRVLLKICRGADYNAAKITISFDPLSQIKTDLLELSRGSISAIDKKFIGTSFSAGSKYVNDNTKWFYGDFPMVYDPCTCNYKSKLNIISELISTANVALEGTIAGDIYSKDVGGKAQIQKPGSFGWKNVPGFINGKLSTANGNISSFITQSQLLSQNIGLLDTTNKESAFDLFGNFLKNNQFLKTGLNAVPWLKSAVGILDIFTGGGKTVAGPQEVKLMPLSVNLTARLNGTITIANQYHDLIFTNPGSKDAQLDPNAYPYYNEVLGIFNLVKTPVLFKSNTGGVCEDNRRAFGVIGNYNFRFDADSLFYVLNGAAGLTIQNMRAAIMIKARPKPLAQDYGYIDTTNMTNAKLSNTFQFFEGKDAVDNSYKFRTDYFDMKCLDRQIFNYRTATTTLAAQKCNAPYTWDANTDTLFLKLMINLKRNNTTPNTQNVLLVLTYPIKTITNAIQLNAPTFATCDSTLLPQATNTFVNAYCNSIAYNNINRQSRAYLDSIVIEKKVEQDGIALFPNPSNGIFTVKLKSLKSTLNQITVHDMLGRLVYTSNEGNFNLDLGLLKQLNLNLSKGTYLLSAKTTNGILKTKFMIVK